MGKKKSKLVWAPKKDRIWIPGVGVINAAEFQQEHVSILTDYIKAHNANVEYGLASVLTLVDQNGQMNILEEKDFKNAVDELDTEKGKELGKDEQ